MSEETSLALLARLLRQRTELGAPPLFLDGLGRDELLARLGARGPGPAASAQPSAERPPVRPVDRTVTRPAPPPPRGELVGPPRPRPGAPADATLRAGEPLPVLPSTHDELKALVSGCMRCDSGVI